MIDLDIRHQVGEFRLQIALTVGDEVLVLFGASGSGKTTTLQCIAGLQEPQHGHIRLNGEVLEANGAQRSVPVHRRRIGYVFQVTPVPAPPWRRTWRLAPAARQTCPSRGMLARMQLADLGSRYPAQLRRPAARWRSPGRDDGAAGAADGRAVRPRRPGARQPAADLLAVQRELHLPVIYVTHSLEDAFAVGTRLAVLHEGRLAQVGPCEEVFQRPRTAAVARLMGTRNVFEGRIAEASSRGLSLTWGSLSPPRRQSPRRPPTASASTSAPRMSVIPARRQAPRRKRPPSPPGLPAEAPGRLHAAAAALMVTVSVPPWRCVLPTAFSAPPPRCRRRRHPGHPTGPRSRHRRQRHPHLRRFRPPSDSVSPIHRRRLLRRGKTAVGAPARGRRRGCRRDAGDPASRRRRRLRRRGAPLTVG